MKARFSTLFLMSALTLALSLGAQEIKVDGDKVSLELDKPGTPMELFLPDGKYTVGAATFAKPELLALDDTEGRKINLALIDAMSGKKESLAALADFKEKATPHLWTLMSRAPDNRKFVASAAAKLPGTNGEALAYRMLLDPQKEVRDAAWQRFADLPEEVRTGVWAHTSLPEVRKAVGDLFNEKERRKNRYQDMRDALFGRNVRARFKQGLDPKNPRWVCHMFLDRVLDMSDIRWKSETDRGDAFKWIKRCEASDTFKTLAQLHLKNPRQKFDPAPARHASWYMRAAFCRALRHRDDLAWEPKLIRALLERLRDVNLHVRDEALVTLRALHPIDIAFGRDRHLDPDREVIRRWSLWWPVLEPHADAFEALRRKDKPLEIRPLGRNTLVYNGSSPRQFPVYKVSDRKLGDLYLIDFNEDGRLSFPTDRYLIGPKGKVNLKEHPPLPLSRLVTVGGKLFRLDIDLDGRALRFDQIKGSKALPQRKVAFTGQYNRDFDAVGVAASPSPDIHLPALPKDSVMLDGSYALVSGWIRHKKNRIAAIITETPHTRQFAIGSDTPAIAYGSALTLELDWEHDRESGKVTLQPVELSGQAGESYRKVDPKIKRIRVAAVTGESTQTMRDWVPFNKLLSSAVMGGLTPPLDEGLVDGLMAAVPGFEQLVLEIPGVQLNLTLKTTDRDNKQTQLDAELAKPVEEQDQALIAQLQGEIATLNTEINDLQTELDEKTAKHNQLRDQLEAAGGTVGLGLEDMIERLKREPGARFMAKALSDIYWEPYVMDLNLTPESFRQTPFEITLNTEVEFGEVKEKRIPIDPTKSSQSKNSFFWPLPPLNSYYRRPVYRFPIDDPVVSPVEPVTPKLVERRRIKPKTRGHRRFRVRPLQFDRTDYKPAFDAGSLKALVYFLLIIAVGIPTLLLISGAGRRYRNRLRAAP